MAISPLPPQLEQLGRRHFAFYPPILAVEHNEWLYGGANWSEIQVINVHSGAEIWIPRRFLGEVSSVDEPILIVGLKRELEFRNGAVRPHQSHVVELPVAVPLAVNQSPRNEARRSGPAPVVNIRLEPSHEARAARGIIVVLVLGVVACSVVIGVARNGRTKPRFDRWQSGQSYLRLNLGDDYAAVIRKLGPPASVNEKPGPRGTLFRSLEYPDRHFSVVLMGKSAASARYVGTLDSEHRVLDSAPEFTGVLP